MKCQMSSCEVLLRDLHPGKCVSSYFAEQSNRHVNTSFTCLSSSFTDIVSRFLLHFRILCQFLDSHGNSDTCTCKHVCF